jgi:hypothetical protein
MQALQLTPTWQLPSLLLGHSKMWHWQLRGCVSCHWPQASVAAVAVVVLEAQVVVPAWLQLLQQQLPPTLPQLTQCL